MVIRKRTTQADIDVHSSCRSVQWPKLEEGRGNQPALARDVIMRVMQVCNPMTLSYVVG